MEPFLQAHGHWQEWAATQRTALATATHLGDTAAQAVSSRLLANACNILGDHDQARGHYATVSAETGHRWVEGAASDSVGYAEHHLGNLAEAAACYQRALSL